jgi:hypothetical protein
MRLISVIINRFCVNSVIDTCAIWHLISSRILFRAALDESCQFVISKYVEYECLSKPRKIVNHKKDELIRRFVKAQHDGFFMAVEMSIEDLQEVARLEEIHRLGKGELSSIALARKIFIGLTTDDRSAFILAQRELARPEDVQTVPQLLGWLIFNGIINDSDKDSIIKEHCDMGESHQEHFEEIYIEAMRCRLMNK